MYFFLLDTINIISTSYYYSLVVTIHMVIYFYYIF